MMSFNEGMWRHLNNNYVIYDQPLGGHLQQHLGEHVGAFRGHL